MSENISSYVEGTFNGRGIAGYHMVMYGETQEYLESLQEKGVILMYSEDNPPEEGKLTISKPNPDPGTITVTVVANPTEYIYGPYEPLQLTVEELIAALGPEKYEALINTTITATTTDTTVTDTADVTSDPEQIVLKWDQDYIALYGKKPNGFQLSNYLVEIGVWPKEADTFIEYPNLPQPFLPSANVNGDWPPNVIAYLNTYFPDWDTDSFTVMEIAALETSYRNMKERVLYSDTTDTTVTDKTSPDTTDTEYHYGQDNWSVGENGELIYKDTTKYIKFTSADLPFCLTTLKQNSVTIPSPSIDYLIETGVLLRVSDYINPETGHLEDLPIPSIVIKNSEQLAFVSTVDAETEAVTSVQVACADDGGWRTVGVLNNPDGIDWKYQAGNLTGSGAASVVWHAQELGALGVWTDGTDNWTGIAGWFDENWTMLGCGDFDGDGKDSVLMSLNGGLFYSVDLDGTLTGLGGLNWGGWEFGASGDFAGDGKDDIVLFHKGLNCVVLLADGNADDYTSIGLLDASDWNIAGAGDFDADGRDDLLVRQTSTGLAGAYAGGDMNRWSVVDTASEYYLA